MNIVDRARALTVQNLSKKIENGQVAKKSPENTGSAAPAERQTGPVDSPEVQLYQSVQSASVWNDIEKKLHKITKAYRQGEVNQATAEMLTHAAIEKSRQIPASIEEMPLENFASSGLVKEVKSKLLGETVIWAADNAQVPPETDQVIYRASELKELAGISPEQLRKIHMLKKTRDWEVVNLEDGDWFQKNSEK